MKLLFNQGFAAYRVQASVLVGYNAVGLAKFIICCCEDWIYGFLIK